MSARVCGVFFVLLGLATLAGVAGSRYVSGSGARSGSVAWGKPGRTRPATFDRPRCISVAPDGTVLCLDLTGRIQRFGPDGEYLAEMQMPDVSVGRPQGMDIDAEGNLYVADTHYDQVVKFNPDGEIILRFGTKGTEPGKFFWPCAIAVASDGRIFTAEYGSEHDRIQVWSPEGAHLASFGGFGVEPGNFMRPMGLAFDSHGELYVADAANHRIQVFSTDGTLLRTWGAQGDEPGRFNYPYDIAVDSEDRVYTVEYGGHRVQCFDRQGRLLRVWGGLGKTPDRLSHPWGLDVTAEGRVFVADTLNCRVVGVWLRDSVPVPSAPSLARLSPGTTP